MRSTASTTPECGTSLNALLLIGSILLVCGFASLLWQCAASQTMIVGLLILATVNDGGLFHGLTHSPIDQTILVKIGNRLAVKLPLVPMRSDVMDKVHEQSLINSVADNVLVGPSLSVRLRKRPRRRFDERFQSIRQWKRVIHFVRIVQLGMAGRATTGASCA